MVPVKLKGKVQVMDDPAKELNATAAQEVTDILEKADKVGETKEPKTNHWFYTVPFTGVRYYSY
jgi:hypothetical protein